MLIKKKKHFQTIEDKSNFIGLSADHDRLLQLKVKVKCQLLLSSKVSDYSNIFSLSMGKVGNK